MTKSFDVMIVGASVAGSSLALRLARRGIRTAVVDKATFPRRKACGEGLSDIALGKLSDLGLAAELRSSEHIPFFGYRAWLGDFHVDLATRSPEISSPKGIGIQRYILDEILVGKLSSFDNVETFLGQKVGSVTRDEAGYVIELGQESLKAKYLVLADGSNSVLASRLGVPRKVSKALSWGISWVFEGDFSEPTENIAVIIKKGYEIYCTPVAKNRVNVCFLARKHLISKLSKFENSIPELDNALEKIHFKGIPLGKPEHIGPIGCTRRPIVYEDILLVGDACESLDPISGMGMTHAFITAELVASSLVSILCKQQPSHVVFRNLSRQRERAIRPYRGFARLTGLLLRGTRKHGKFLALLARTSLPSKVRDVLSSEIFEKRLPSNATAMLLALAGFDLLHARGF